MRRSTKSLIAALVLSSNVIMPLSSPADEIIMASLGQADLLNESGLGQAVSNENLGELNGRQDMNINNLEMQLVNSDQSAQANGNNISLSGSSTMTNGGNIISGNAFSNASGIVTVIQNSGNQVLIQNDLILNLTVK